jgi:Nitronate monooxygenase
MALVPETADAICVPVIAAGRIADGGGIAVFALGASGAQIGTGFLGRRVGAASRRRATCGCTRPSSRESTMMSGSDPNTSIIPTKSIDGAIEVRENLERDPSLGRKDAVYMICERRA